MVWHKQSQQHDVLYLLCSIEDPVGAETNVDQVTKAEMVESLTG